MKYGKIKVLYILTNVSLVTNSFALLKRTILFEILLD